MLTKKKNQIKYTDVFVPGGLPTYTYNPRESRRLEDSIRGVTSNFKLLVITGPTKSGKTVLVNNVFPREENLWIDGGSINTEDNFWEQIVSGLGGYTEEQLSNGEDVQHTLSSGIQVVGNAWLAKVSSEATGMTSSIGTTARLQRRNMSNKSKAISLLQEFKVPLIIDDFHYIAKVTQKQIVRALKAPIMYGVPVICIAIPSRKFDVIDVERELTGRMASIEMPTWDNTELSIIAENGFSALNITIPQSTIEYLSSEAFGSPFLMQDFCRSICQKFNIEYKQRIETPLDISRQSVSEVFPIIADNSGRSMFDKLKRGPRTRTDRKPRTMKNGEITDIYDVVLEALKYLRPGIETISYDTLRANIREVLADDLPQHGEIARVLEKIAQISHTDTSSTPVINWQKDDDILTVTDPFFAFYLRWSSN